MATMHRRRKLLGRTLVEKGLITEEQLRVALETQRTSRRRLGRVLVDLGFISELEMYRAVGDQDGLPFPDRFLPLFLRAPRHSEGERVLP